MSKNQTGKFRSDMFLKMNLKKMRPSDFLRYFGFTDGAFECGIFGLHYFFLSAMDEADRSPQLKGGSSPVAFFHPAIYNRFGYIASWHASFQTKDGTYLEPCFFAKTPEGFGFEVLTDVVDGKWKTKTYLFADLIRDDVRPVFWEGRTTAHPRLKASSKVFIRKKVSSVRTA